MWSSIKSILIFVGMQLWLPFEIIGFIVKHTVKADWEDHEESSAETEVKAPSYDPVTLAESISALCSLGFNKTTAKERVTSILCNKPSASTEEVVKLALKRQN